MFVCATALYGFNSKIYCYACCKYNVLVYFSQSGGTPETRNGLLEVQKAFREAGLDFAKQVLISGFSFCL